MKDVGSHEKRRRARGARGRTLAVAVMSVAGAIGGGCFSARSVPLRDGSVEEDGATLPGVGGRSATGGGPGTGGARATGSGGVDGTAGRPGAGGASATGGISGSAGASATGGTPGTGGRTGSGGVPATGGAPGTGGRTGSGGVPATGGATGTGGRTGSGGVPATGGAPGTGGVPGTGGQAGGGGTAAPSPYVYESFDYPAGLLDNPTVPNAGGIGFVGPWTGTDAQVQGAGLTYAQNGLTLATAGRSALLNKDTYATVSRMIDVNAFPADMRDTTGMVGAAGKEMWLSVVMYADPADTTSAFAYGAISLDDTTATTAGNERRSLGYTRSASTDPYLWSLGRDGYTFNGISTVSAAAPAVVIVRFQFGTVPDGTALTMLWVNPDISQSPQLGVPDAQLSTGPFRFNRIRFHNWLSPAHIDEVRMGPTYPSVIPVLH